MKRKLTLLQLMTAALAVFCGWYGSCLFFDLRTSDLVLPAAAMALVILNAEAMLALFLLLCQRLKAEKAFSVRNERTLGAMAVLCAVCTALLLFIAIFQCFSSISYAILYGLLTLLGLAVTLIIWTLCLLMRRAAELQQENDETV